MTKSSDMVTMIQRRSGLSDTELSRRSGIARETIGRWRRAEQEPSLQALTRLAAAGGLTFDVSLAAADDSLDPLVDDQLRLSPLQRIRSLVRPDSDGTLRVLRWIARHVPEHVLVGEVADVLLGSPQSTRGVVDVVLPHDRHVSLDELLLDSGAWPADRQVYGPLAWELDGGGVLRLVESPPGTSGYTDLRRDAEPLVFIDDDGQSMRLTVASPLDLLRIAESWEPGRARSPGLHALLDARRRTSAMAAA